MDEQQLINDLRNKSTRYKAFSVLVSMYSEQLYWTARHILGVHEDADDVVQNSYIKVWNKLDEFRGDSKLSTWLHRIVVNESLDHIRREKKHTNDTAVGELNNTFADNYFNGDETELLLREAIDTLPEAQRTVFCMKYFEDMQYKDISQILGTSEGGLKANYHHAAEKIRKYILSHSH